MSDQPNDRAIIYGISNCDTVKKARQWLSANAIEYEFHDYRKKGIDHAHLKQWSQVLGWENLLNKRGTTWRRLSEDKKQDLDPASAIELMIDNTSLIKRPVVELGDTLLLGFDEMAWATAFGIS